MSNQYTQEFRDRAVELSMSSDRSVREVAEELGINQHTLFLWRKKYRKRSSKDTWGGTTPDRSSSLEEVRDLRRELKRVTQERDILKKAVGYFARPDQK